MQGSKFASVAMQKNCYDGKPKAEVRLIRQHMARQTPVATMHTVPVFVGKTTGHIDLRLT